MRVALLAVAIVAGCASGPSPTEQEWQSYTRYLRSEVQAGRMSQQQAEYLAVAKRNELISKQRSENAATAASAAYGIGLMQSGGPYQNGPNVTCSTAGAVTTCR